MDFLNDPMTGAALDEDAAITVTPLIDVVFNLLIFFMLSTSFAHSQGLGIELPKASEAASATSTGAITLNISSSGEMFLDSTKTDLLSLPQALAEATLKTSTGPHTLIIQADRKVPHGTVVHAMNEAVKLKIANISVGALPGDGK